MLVVVGGFVVLMDLCFWVYVIKLSSVCVCGGGVDEEGFRSRKKNTKQEWEIKNVRFR